VPLSQAPWTPDPAPPIARSPASRPAAAPSFVPVTRP